MSQSIAEQGPYFVTIIFSLTNAFQVENSELFRNGAQHDIEQKANQTSPLVDSGNLSDQE